jgi:hypothetical protein
VCVCVCVCVLCVVCVVTATINVIAISVQTWTGPEGSERLPEFLDNPHRKEVMLSALLTGRLYPTRDTHSSDETYYGGKD